VVIVWDSDAGFRMMSVLDLANDCPCLAMAITLNGWPDEPLSAASTDLVIPLAHIFPVANRLKNWHGNPIKVQLRKGVRDLPKPIVITPLFLDWPMLCMERQCPVKIVPVFLLHPSIDEDPFGARQAIIKFLVGLLRAFLAQATIVELRHQFVLPFDLFLDPFKMVAHLISSRLRADVNPGSASAAE